MSVRLIHLHLATCGVYGMQVVQSSLTLALNPDSKIAKENLDVFADAWVQQINELSTLVRDVGDSFHGNKTEKQLYLSLPRPGVGLSVYFRYC